MISVDERSLEKVLSDLEYNLSKKQMKKLLNKGTKAAALKMKKAIIANAGALGVESAAAKVVKIRQLRTGKGGMLNGHHIFIGRGKDSRGAYKLGDEEGFELPVVWIEYGTYNHRNWAGDEPYTPETMKRHPDAMAKNAGAGNIGIHPRPFIRAAYDANKRAAFTTMLDAVEVGVRQFRITP